MDTSNSTTKRCSHCKNSYPLTSEYWHKSKGRPGGFHNYCKQCRSLLRKQTRLANPELYREKDRLYREQHIEQDKLKSKRWRENNPEQYKNMRSSYRVRKRQEISDYNHKYRSRNADWINSKRREYRREHPEKTAKQAKEYREKHPHIVLRNTQRRRARKLLAQGSHSIREVQILFFHQRCLCFHCAVDLFVTGYHQDHWIPLSRGGNDYIENIRLLCPTCNLQKGNKLPSEWNTKYCD